MKEYQVKVHDNGDRFWYVNGKLHRENGPAIEGVNGYRAWWVNGKELTEQEFNNYTNRVQIVSKKA